MLGDDEASFHQATKHRQVLTGGRLHFGSGRIKREARQERIQLLTVSFRHLIENDFAHLGELGLASRFFLRSHNIVIIISGIITIIISRRGKNKSGQEDCGHLQSPLRDRGVVGLSALLAIHRLGQKMRQVRKVFRLGGAEGGQLDGLLESIVEPDKCSPTKLLAWIPGRQILQPEQPIAESVGKLKGC